MMMMLRNAIALTEMEDSVGALEPIPVENGGFSTVPR